jgi:hypothetical protein
MVRRFTEGSSNQFEYCRRLHRFIDLSIMQSFQPADHATRHSHHIYALKTGYG